jgi:hypothetical protein
MKWFLLMLCLAVTAGAEPMRISPKDVRKGVQQVVEAQLAAFHENEYGEAYALASASIQRQFSAALFERMIKRGYPALARHARAELGLVHDDGEGRAEVVVSVYDAQERQTDFRYLVVLQGEEWRVNGVVAAPPPKRGDT